MRWVGARHVRSGAPVRSTREMCARACRIHPHTAQGGVVETSKTTNHHTVHQVGTSNHQRRRAPNVASWASATTLSRTFILRVRKPPPDLSIAVCHLPFLPESSISRDRVRPT